MLDATNTLAANLLVIPDLSQPAGWLPLVFALVMALAMLAYVILDGYDLGVGVLLRRADDDEQKDAMIASIGPFWDANETWLVLGVGVLLVAFPLAHGVILQALYLTHDWNGEVQGIKAFGDKHPPVLPVFWASRIMVGVGMLMLAVSWFSAWQTRKGRHPPDWLARVLVAMTFAGWVALIAGWYVTEIGRQPWLVQGVLLAKDAASTQPAPHIALTLAMYLVLYAVLLAAYVSVLFYLAGSAAKKARTGVDEAQGVPHAL